MFEKIRDYLKEQHIKKLQAEAKKRYKIAPQYGVEGKYRVGIYTPLVNGIISVGHAYENLDWEKALETLNRFREDFINRQLENEKYIKQKKKLMKY